MNVEVRRLSDFMFFLNKNPMKTNENLNRLISTIFVTSTSINIYIYICMYIF
jgi:hypothetical protein